MQSAVEVFGTWAKQGKDQGMERGHRPAVDAMLAYALERQQGPFRAIDAGCGNGWVVRLLRELPGCLGAQGVDGAQAMIEKARSLDPKGSYHHADLLAWKPAARVELVHSMEVLYYFPDPGALLALMARDWLEPGGRLICGLDHYRENPASLSWPQDVGIAMTSWTQAAWETAFREAGFLDVEAWRFGPREDWAGTLVLTGTTAQA